MIARGVLSATGLAGLLIAASPGMRAPGPLSVAGPVRATLPSAAQAAETSPCPRGTLPDGPVCIRLPSFPFDLPEAEAAPNAHRDRRGTFQVYEQIPRRPERPADYEAYRYPIPPALPGGRHVVSGYDLDRPDEAQRRGRHLRAVGHGGLDIPQARGTPVKVVSLEAQQGDAEVIYVGPLFGTTVVTRHSLREGGQLRDYLVLFGHLERPAPGVAPGSRAAEGDVVGFVGDTGSPELVHLHLEARRVREGVDVAKLSPARLLDASVSVVSDPRNVLPRKP